MLAKIHSNLSLGFILSTCMSCSSVSFPTVAHVDLDRYMGTWYVSAGRFTIFERNANNAVEMYRYEKQSQTIDIDFSYRKGSPSGKEKRFPQKGKVVEGSQNAHWKVSPFWPLKFDYLIIALAEDYSWVAVGVPNQKYLWIMHRKKEATRKEITDILDHVKAIGYNVQDIEYVPQKWN